MLDDKAAVKIFVAILFLSITVGMALTYIYYYRQLLIRYLGTQMHIDERDRRVAFLNSSQHPILTGRV
ncbi:unnamed protein product [Darwinula stevensoni]|uniref:Uncharacterized protein n=1 Tax=Darwinula stevensoni TaxID=69355 RepID=A0A7R9AIQ0_9CRUS|nr:unnamed protein product [Darwinula stevensoni]CAG0906526.1 unnamed protein product [Darwinula stevensoni]